VKSENIISVDGEVSCTQHGFVSTAACAEGSDNHFSKGNEQTISTSGLSVWLNQEKEEVCHIFLKIELFHVCNLAYIYIYIYIL